MRAEDWLPWPAWLTLSSRSVPASSSSAAASSAPRSPTTWRTWAGRRRAARARPAHLGHHLARGRADGHVRLDVGDLDRDAQVHRATSTPGSRPRPARRPASSRSGFIEVASDADRLEEYRRVVGVQPATAASTCTRSRRARSASCSRSRAPTTCSPASTSPRTAGPTRSTSRWRWPRARGCRARRILEGVPVTGVLTARRRGRPACAPPHGDIEAEYVVNCAGMWARQLGAQAGVNIPLQAAEHYYLITEQIAEVSPRLAGARGPGSLRLLPRGGRRADGRPVRAGLRAVEGRRRSPTDFSFGEIPPDWDRMGPYLEKAMSRVPISMEAGIRKFFCGPESFTPDLQPVVGEAPELEELLRRRRAQLDRHPHRRRHRPRAGALDRQRPRPTSTSPASTSTGCTRYQANPEYRRDPHRRVARHGLPVPLPDAVDADRARRQACRRSTTGWPRSGAYFRDVSGWEGADWYAPDGRRAGRRASCPGAGRTGSPTGRPSTAPPARA